MILINISKFKRSNESIILLAIVLQTSFLTPPFGFSLFYLRGVAGDNIQTKEIYKGVVPFIVIQLVALALVILFPWILIL